MAVQEAAGAVPQESLHEVVFRGVSTQGQLLRALRAVRGLNLKEAAAGAGISKSALWQYENDLSELGRVALEKLADFYGVSTDYLLLRRATPSRITGKARNRRTPQVTRPIQSPLVSIASQ